MIKLRKELFTLLLVVMAMCVTSCNSQHRELEKMVKQANDELPARFDFGIATSIECHDGMVIIHYTTDDELFPIGVLKNKGDIIKRAWKMSYFGQNQGGKNEVLDLILSSGYGLKAVFESEKTNDHIEVALNNDELKQAVKQPVGISEQLAIQMEITNASLPMQVDAVTTLLSTTIDGDYMTYNYEIDDSQLAIDEMENQRATYVDNIGRGLRDAMGDVQSSAGMFFKQVIKAGKGVRYRYKGKASGKTLDIDFTNAQLRQMVDKSLL